MCKSFFTCLVITVVVVVVVVVVRMVGFCEMAAEEKNTCKIM